MSDIRVTLHSSLDDAPVEDARRPTASRPYLRAGWRDLAPIDDDSVLMGWSG